MEGAHKQQRQLTDMLVGDNLEAAAKRRRAQYGAAAAGRRGQSIQAARARNGMPDMKVLAEDAEAAMKAGNALVQASVEHLEEAERSWDKYVKESGSKIRGFPTEKQVLMYLSYMSRTRERECLAQRGKRRKGRQRSVARNYVLEMAYNRCGRPSTQRSRSWTHRVGETIGAQERYPHETNTCHARSIACGIHGSAVEHPHTRQTHKGASTPQTAACKARPSKLQ